MSTPAIFNSFCTFKSHWIFSNLNFRILLWKEDHPQEARSVDIHPFELKFEIADAKYKWSKLRLQEMNKQQCQKWSKIYREIFYLIIGYGQS